MSIPEEAWRDSYPIGEVPPRAFNEWDALKGAESSIHAHIAKVGRDITDTRAKRDAVIEAAAELNRLSEAGVEFGSDIWLDAQGRLFDAVQRLFPPRLDMTGLARSVLSDDGAS